MRTAVEKRGMPRWPRAPFARPLDLLAYGDPNIDQVWQVTSAPRADQKVLGRRLGAFAGGTVANAACAASLLGCRTMAFGRVGDDADGRFLFEAYRQAGVATEQLRAFPATASASALVMIEEDGEKAVVYAPMDGPLFDEARLVLALPRSAMLYAMPYDFGEFRMVQNLARAHGTLVAIDVEAAMLRADGDAAALLGLADIVFMNGATYRAAFGREATLEHMRAQLAHGVRLLVVTRGADGALAVTLDAACAHPAFKARLVDSTGAGDCFNGAFLAALAQGRALDDCLRFACAAASFAVAGLGARTGQPTLAQVDALLAAVTPPALTG